MVTTLIINFSDAQGQLTLYIFLLHCIWDLYKVMHYNRLASSALLI